MPVAHTDAQTTHRFNPLLMCRLASSLESKEHTFYAIHITVYVPRYRLTFIHTEKLSFLLFNTHTYTHSTTPKQHF